MFVTRPLPRVGTDAPLETKLELLSKLLKIDTGMWEIYIAVCGDKMVKIPLNNWLLTPFEDADCMKLCRRRRCQQRHALTHAPVWPMFGAGDGGRRGNYAPSPRPCRDTDLLMRHYETTHASLTAPS